MVGSSIKEKWIVDLPCLINCSESENLAVPNCLIGIVGIGGGFWLLFFGCCFLV